MTARPPPPSTEGGRRSIVPQGFEWAAHPCFNEYAPPRFESIDSRRAPSDDDDDEASGAASARARDDDAGDPPLRDPSCPICLRDCCAEPMTLISRAAGLPARGSGASAAPPRKRRRRGGGGGGESAPPKCLHTFCRRCITRWFAVSTACPLCKMPCAAAATLEADNSLLLFAVLTDGRPEAAPRAPPAPTDALDRGVLLEALAVQRQQRESAQLESQSCSSAASSVAPATSKRRRVGVDAAPDDCGRDCGDVGGGRGETCAGSERAPFRCK